MYREKPTWSDLLIIIISFTWFGLLLLLTITGLTDKMVFLESSAYKKVVQ